MDAPVHFPPVSRKLLFPPYFDKFPLCFTQIHLLFAYFTCISFPPTFTVMHLCITQCTYWTPLCNTTIQCNMILGKTLQYITMQYNAKQFSTIQYYTMQYNAKQYNTKHIDTLLNNTTKVQYKIIQNYTMKNKTM